MRRPALPAGALVVSAGGAVVWARRLFREPGARRIASLVDELGARSIVAVLAHPDDEIKVAGLLDDAGHRPGVTARLVTAARGDGGIASPEFPRATLAQTRAAEVRRHGAELGLTEQEVWPHDDAHLPDEPLAQLTARIVARLRAWQPDVVVTFHPTTGFTAHPDHLRIGAAATAAVCAVPPALLFRRYDDEHYVAWDRARACGAQPGGRQNSAVGSSPGGSPGQP